MNIVILAAGRGSRLNSFTEDNPKCLVELNGEELLLTKLKVFYTLGFYDVYCVVGYKYRKLNKYNLNLIYNEHWNNTNIFDSLLLADHILGLGETIVCYGDIFFNIDDLVRLINDNNNIVLGYDPNGVKHWSKRFNDPLTDIENFKINYSNMKITQIGGVVEKIEDVQGQYLGIFKTTPNSWRKIKDIYYKHGLKSIDMTTLFNYCIVNGMDVYGVPFYEEWGEIDTPNDLNFYKKV